MLKRTARQQLLEAKFAKMTNAPAAENSAARGREDMQQVRRHLVLMRMYSLCLRSAAPVFHRVCGHSYKLVTSRSMAV
jgi:hypothetical protein